MFKTFKRWFSRPRDPSGHVYYARLATPRGIFYKIGYTKKSSLAERFSYLGCLDYQLVDREFFFTHRRDAWDVEQTLLEHFDKRRAFGKFSNDPAFPLNGRGQGELFRYDVLGLDDEAYKDVADFATVEQRKSFVENINASFWMIIIGLVLLPFTLGWSLLLIAGGVAGFFGGSNDGRPARGKRRPVHPPAIQCLVNALARQSTGDRPNYVAGVPEEALGSYFDEARADREARAAARARAALAAARTKREDADSL